MLIMIFTGQETNLLLGRNEKKKHREVVREKRIIRQTKLHCGFLCLYNDKEKKKTKSNRAIGDGDKGNSDEK